MRQGEKELPGGQDYMDSKTPPMTTFPVTKPTPFTRACWEQLPVRKPKTANASTMEGMDFEESVSFRPHTYWHAHVTLTDYRITCLLI